jgi:hypothetical protein
MTQPSVPRPTAAEASPWRVGILFSRSGVMSISESEHFFGTVLAIEEINAAGGVLGRQIEPVALDPKSDPLEYRRLADQLLLDEGVSVIFGCSTSSSRKAVLPAIERRNGLLWYCSMYEGFEFSPNLIYTGAAPNQNSLQLAAWLLGEGRKRWHLIGSDYIYPRESNRIMRDVVEDHGGEITGEVYLPYEANTGAVARATEAIKAAQPDVVFSTLVGRPGREFYRLYRELGIDPRKTPIASLTMGEGDRPRAVRRSPHLVDLLRVDRDAAQPAFRRRVPRTLRRRGDGRHVGRGRVQPGASVRACARAGRHARHAEARRRGAAGALRRAVRRAAARCRQPPCVAAAPHRPRARGRRLRAGLGIRRADQTRSVPDDVRMARHVDRGPGGLMRWRRESSACSTSCAASPSR